MNSFEVILLCITTVMAYHYTSCILFTTLGEMELKKRLSKDENFISFIESLNNKTGIKDVVCTYILIEHVSYMRDVYRGHISAELLGNNAINHLSRIVHEATGLILRL